MSMLERAIAGNFDVAFETKLAEAIVTAIAEASMVDGVMVIRTGEIAAALVTVLASVAALSPASARSPTAIRRIAESFRKKLTTQVRTALADPLFHDCRARAFRDDDRERGGNA
jgi:hypothetical protein